MEFSASNDDPLSQQSPAQHPQPRPAGGAGSSAGQGGDDNRPPASAHADGTSKRKGRPGKGFVPKITPSAGAKPKGRKGRRGPETDLTTTPVLSPNHGQHNTPVPHGSVGMNYPCPPTVCRTPHGLGLDLYTGNRTVHRSLSPRGLTRCRPGAIRTTPSSVPELNLGNPCRAYLIQSDSPRHRNYFDVLESQRPRRYPN